MTQSATLVIDGLIHLPNQSGYTFTASGLLYIGPRVCVCVCVYVCVCGVKEDQN